MEIDWNSIKFEYEEESNLISYIEVEEMVQELPTTMEVNVDEKFLNANEIKFEQFEDINEEIDDDMDYEEPQLNYILELSNQQNKSESLYMCSICSLDFPSLAYWKRHNNTKKHQGAFEMAQRGKKFNQKRKYVRKNEVKNKNFATLESKNDITSGQYLLDNQEISVDSKQEVIEHQDIHILNQSESQNAYIYGENYFQQPLSSNQQLPIIYCQPCNKYFKLRCHFTQHVNSVHSGAKNFKCKTCGKRYETKERLEEHMVRHTVSNKPFKCTKCDRSYINKIDLKRHEKTHEAVRDYICRICGNGFVRLDHLEKHYSIHQRMINMGLGALTRNQKNSKNSKNN